MPPKLMFFWKKSEGGGGGGFISGPKNFIADFLHSKRYILVIYFGKNVQKGGGGGVISNPKKIIANLRKLTHIYKFLRKKSNEERPFGLFPKNINFWEHRHPIVATKNYDFT